MSLLPLSTKSSECFGDDLLSEVMFDLDDAPAKLAALRYEACKMAEIKRLIADACGEDPGAKLDRGRCTLSGIECPGSGCRYRDAYLDRRCVRFRKLYNGQRHSAFLYDP